MGEPPDLELIGEINSVVVGIVYSANLLIAFRLFKLKFYYGLLALIPLFALIIGWKKVPDLKPQHRVDMMIFTALVVLGIAWGVGARIYLIRNT